MAFALRWRRDVPPLVLALALVAQAPEVEDYFDRQSDEADAIDAFELPLFDRIVRFPRRTDSIQLVAVGALDWYAHEARRGVGWQVQLAFRFAFDALLVPSPRAIGAPKIEAARIERCLRLASALPSDPIGRRAVRARLRALRCEVSP